MKKRLFALVSLLAALMLCVPAFAAEEIVPFSGAVLAYELEDAPENSFSFGSAISQEEDAPYFVFTVEQTSFEEDLYTFSMAYALDEENASSQTMRFTSSLDMAQALYAFEDFNFDGFLDLVVLSARGVANEFFDVYLWDHEAQTFHKLDTAGVELCSYTLFPQEQLVLTYSRDSAAEHTRTALSFGGDLHNQLNIIRQVTLRSAEENPEDLILQCISGGDSVFETTFTSEQDSISYTLLDAWESDFLLQNILPEIGA